jgi:hypothetical protein
MLIFFPTPGKKGIDLEEEKKQKEPKLAHEKKRRIKLKREHVRGK